mgnify:CR=1 FL=1
MSATIIQRNKKPMKKVKVDSVTIDIIESALRNARYEMDTVLFRTAMSPGIREQHVAVDRDRALAERVHMTVTATAPKLSPKTWYGMPAYENADGKVVVFFQDSGKFNYRYSTLGFQDAANLDDGDLWPVSYALQNWSPVVEKKVVELVKAAVS